MIVWGGLRERRLSEHGGKILRAIWSNTNPDPNPNSADTYAYRNARPRTPTPTPTPTPTATANHSYRRTFNDSRAYSNADSFAYGYTNTNGDSHTYSNAERHPNPHLLPDRRRLETFRLGYK